MTDGGGLEQYISKGRATVPGWLQHSDAHLLAAAAEIGPQRGDLVEVGVFLGASAIELGFLRRCGDQLILVDPFEDVPDDRWAPNAGLSVDRFLANWRRFHDDDPTVLVGRSETELPVVAAASARLVHIDGNHHYEVVRHDVGEAIRIAAPGAVIVLDDVGPWQWPSVAAAVWKSVTDGELVPLAVTSAKLYATPATAPAGAEHLAAAARRRGLVVEGPHPVCGQAVWEVHPPVPTTSLVRRLAREAVPPALTKGVRKLDLGRRLPPVRFDRSGSLRWAVRSRRNEGVGDRRAP